MTTIVERYGRELKPGDAILYDDDRRVFILGRHVRDDEWTYDAHRPSENEPWRQMTRPRYNVNMLDHASVKRKYRLHPHGERVYAEYVAWLLTQ